MNRAVMIVPTPGMKPSAKPTPTQTRSLMMRMTRKGRTSLRVGYENALTFSNIFKSYYGLSPAHYRQQKRKAEEEVEEMRSMHDEYH